MTVTKKTETQRWFRGYGPDQYVYYAQEGPKKYLGGTFEVESMDELEKYVPVAFTPERPLRFSSESQRSPAPKS
jgi:hypothetical protein